jgi:hypothetical protein
MRAYTPGSADGRWLQHHTTADWIFKVVPREKCQLMVHCTIPGSILLRCFRCIEISVNQMNEVEQVISVIEMNG